ncbi:hypothetical protein MIMGU_mgv1a026345mg [Erythranthe guttata]|uniref:NB-ARC domain-containing protein n=1 Tax=Erythranthe guttata TaxID=4155 RepID=A0A022PQL7_ERYGU|nr:hypothetical protein MIMGU_mgv1a026345mg [Erythranthe guttata]
MADAAVTFLLEKVTLVLKYYGDLIGGAENELQSLKSELESLKVAAHKSKKQKVFKHMEMQTRDVVHEVEDTLDTCLAAAAAAAEKEEQRRLAPVMTIRRDNVVVGLGEVEKTIAGYIMEQREELDVISIIGMPGLGKTTLASKIYESDIIQSEFHIRIWVNVSQNFNKKELLLGILKEFSSEDLSEVSEQELEEEVIAFLEEEMFLIVFDDVWTVENWNAIKNVLPTSNGMGKVIITSRKREVGAAASPVRGPYMLRFLTKDESWELLKMEVFQDVGGCPEELEAVGQEIAAACDGMPHTVVVIGGILAAQYTKQRLMWMIREDWINVSKDMTYFLSRHEDMRVDILAMSYDTLPDELRECFLYMGVFPEDHEIPAWTLTSLWIAEGFVQQKESQTLEQTARDYLNGLVSMNLLIVGRTNPMGENKTFRVHDQVRAFCISKAAELNLFHEVKKSSNEGLFEQPIQNYRRVCFHSDDLPDFLSEKPVGKSVRSFLCFRDRSIDLETKYITAIPDAFGLLRVLDSKSIKFTLFPTRLVKLIHLRYVTLRVDDLKILPEPMSQLFNLQTLVVETKSRTLAMKANIWRMVWLRHLKTKAAIVLDQKWEGDAGENLQTLSTLSPESCTESVSNRARNIRELGICGNLNETLLDNDNKFLENLRLLEKLKLVHDVHYEAANDKDYKPMIRLPQHNRFPPNLKRLTLTKTSLDWRHMSTTLAMIPKLEVLKLKDNAFTGMVWTAVGGGFPSLQFLLVEDADLVIWKASDDHFPSLACLSIKNCGKLIEIPMEVAKNLQKLDIDFLRRSATDSARNILRRKGRDQEEQNVRWGARFQLSVGSGCES